jgi:TonB family protein
MASAEPSTNQGSRNPLRQLSAIAERVVPMTGSNGAAIAFRLNNGIVTLASHGEHVPAVGARVRPTSFAGRCIQEEKLLICQDTETDPRVDAASCRVLNVRSMVAAPIVSKGRAVGVLAVYASQPNIFLDDKLNLIRTFATVAGEMLAPEASHKSEPAPTVPEEDRKPEAAPAAAPAPAAEPEPEPENPAIRITPVEEETRATIEPQPVAATSPVVLPEPVAEPRTVVAEAAPPQTPEPPALAPESVVAPEDIRPDGALEPAKEEDGSEPMLLSSFEEEKPDGRRRFGLKLAIILLVVAAIAAGQWFLRGRIVDVIHRIRERIPVRTRTVQPVTPAPTPLRPPANLLPAPAPANPALAAPATTTPQPDPRQPAAPAKPASGGQNPVPSRTTQPASGPLSHGQSSGASAGRSAASMGNTAGLKPPQLLNKVEPVHPAGLKVNSTVVLNATIQKDGSIGKVTVISGDPSLQQAAIAAVKGWKYMPASQNGQPVVATVPIDVTFGAAH